jgi:hypothetical protein
MLIPVFLCACCLLPAACCLLPAACRCVVVAICATPRAAIQDTLFLLLSNVLFGFALLSA